MSKIVYCNKCKEFQNLKFWPCNNSLEEKRQKVSFRFQTWNDSFMFIFFLHHAYWFLNMVLSKCLPVVSQYLQLTTFSPFMARLKHFPNRNFRSSKYMYTCFRCARVFYQALLTFNKKHSHKTYFAINVIYKPGSFGNWLVSWY